MPALTYALLCVVPNRLTVPAMIGGLVLGAIRGATQPDAGGLIGGLGASALALFAGLAPMALVFYAGGIGGGDVKLVGAVGAITASWPCVLGAVFYGFVIAAVMALVLMIRHGIVKRTFMRLLGAAWTAAARIKPVLPTDSPKVPFAMGMCVGGMLAGAEVLLGLQLPWS